MSKSAFLVIARNKDIEAEMMEALKNVSVFMQLLETDSKMQMATLPEYITALMEEEGGSNE